MPKYLGLDFYRRRSCDPTVLFSQTSESLDANESQTQMRVKPTVRFDNRIDFQSNIEPKVWVKTESDFPFVNLWSILRSTQSQSETQSSVQKSGQTSGALSQRSTTRFTVSPKQSKHFSKPFDKSFESFKRNMNSKKPKHIQSSRNPNPNLKTRRYPTFGSNIRTTETSGSSHVLRLSQLSKPINHSMGSQKHHNFEVKPKTQTQTEVRVEVNKQNTNQLICNSIQNAKPLTQNIFIESIVHSIPEPIVGLIATEANEQNVSSNDKPFDPKNYSFRKKRFQSIGRKSDETIDNSNKKMTEKKTDLQSVGQTVPTVPTVTIIPTVPTTGVLNERSLQLRNTGNERQINPNLHSFATDLTQNPIKPPFVSKAEEMYSNFHQFYSQSVEESKNSSSVGHKQSLSAQIGDLRRKLFKDLNEDDYQEVSKYFKPNEPSGEERRRPKPRKVFNSFHQKVVDFSEIEE